jgi:dolichol-phosphate mannosyltransferase
VRALILVPTYNEAANIDAMLRRVRAAAPDADVLVIDDNSPDGTAELAEKVNADLGGVSVLRREAKTGLGDAYRAGLTWALADGADMFVTMDADLSHDPDALPEMLRACEAGADLVVGSRYAPGGSIATGWPRRREALSRWANRYVRLALSLDVADCTAGYKVYRADLVRRIQLDDSRADGYAFQIEAVYRATWAGAGIREVPIVFTDRAAGRSKLSWKTIVEALGLVAWWGLRARLGRPVVELDTAGTTG